MIYLTLSSNYPHPKAGQSFYVTVTLETAATAPLQVTFEKHRVYVDQSGVRALCVIEQDYFTNDGVPQPIKIKAGDTQGSTSVKIAADAKNPVCPPPPGNPTAVPVMFPDRLMLTAFVSPEGSSGDPLGKEHLVLTIKPAF